VLTEALLLYVRHDDVRVSVVMPGSVNTHFSGSYLPERSWPLEADDVALAVLQLLDYPKGAHVSRVEMRPSQPRKG
jgi:NADP-dependent 3-hydroxy acid dehydrogenase YdfG